MKNNLNFIKKIIFFLFIQLLYPQLTFSENINKFNIQGNDRVSDETVIMFSSLKLGDKIDENQLNEALKKLYYTDYFKEVKL